MLTLFYPCDNISLHLYRCKDEILFNGISTIEINERKSPNRRIMHNKISEGGTELISQKIMEHLGRPYEKGRYENQAKFVGKVFESLGTIIWQLHFGQCVLPSSSTAPFLLYTL